MVLLETDGKPKRYACTGLGHSISIVEKKKNENYIEFDFRMGTVLVIFSFF